MSEADTAGIEHVEGFRTTDSQIFLTYGDALCHQQRLDFFKWCEETICRGGEWSATMVAEEVWNNWSVKRTLVRRT